MAGRDQQINLCVLGCPLPPYIKDQGRRRPALGGARQGSRIPTPSRNRFPPFLVQLGEGGKGGEWRRKGEGGRAPNPLSNSDRAWEGRVPPPGCCLSFLLRPIKAQYSCPYSRNSRYSEKYPNHSEPFRCANIVVQYIDLYVSTILRLLVMSPISSGTPNYLRYIKSHKLIIPIVTEL